MKRQGFVRKMALAFGLCSGVTFGQQQLSFSGPDRDFGGGRTLPVVWNAPNNPIFYDHPLLLKQYGFGVLGSMVAGMFGFYIGNAFEGAIFHGRSHEGYLSFTGINFRYNRGPYWGGGSGILLGSTLTAFFVGEMDEEEGSIFWTVVGGTATTAAAFALADLAGVQKDGSHGLLPFVPLVLIPTTGAVAGYDISRWFNDKKRRKITEPGSATLLLPPRLAIAPRIDGLDLRLDALNLSF